MSDRRERRQWHDELTDLISEEATEHLSRARHNLSKKRQRRLAREQARQAKAQIREQLGRDELDRSLAKVAISELERRYSGAGVLPIAVVMGVSALAVLIAVIANPGLFPLLFVAFGFAMGSAGMYGDHLKSKKLLEKLRPLAAGESVVEGQVLPEREAPRTGSKGARDGGHAPDALDQRIEEACQRLEQALKVAPSAVRDFLGDRPQRTIDELRATSKDFQQRERALRAMSAPEARARVQADNDALQSRIDKATDEGVRSSLFQARAALQQKQAHLDELGRSADRLEAERMRLSYTLEGLLAQLLRIQYSDGALASEDLPIGLREGLEKLHAELNALAEASEEVERIEDAAFPEPLGEVEDRDGQRSGSARSRTRDRK